MAAKKANIFNILQITKDIKKGVIHPVYLLCGEDSFGIDTALKAIDKAVQPFLSTEFDKDILYGADIKGVEDIIKIASAFPFGSEKKLLVIKEFDKIKDKKNLTSYIENPADFTVLVLIHNGNVTSFSPQPFKILLEKNFCYEAKELKEEPLSEWIMLYAEEKRKKLSKENALLLIDIVGLNRNLLEIQLQKVIEYAGDEENISFESIKKVVSSLKENNIFDLQNAVAQRKNALAMKVAYNLLDNGNDASFIVAMMNRYFTGLAQLPELEMNKLPDQAIARIVGTHPYYLKGQKEVRKFYTDDKLLIVFNALHEADVSIKTTSADQKTIVTILLAKILTAK